MPLTETADYNGRLFGRLCLSPELDSPGVELCGAGVSPGSHGAPGLWRDGPRAGRFPENYV
ncbi:hypothetical protein RGE_03230 [Rubrivivax gelatinosus IL144]|uniref:Uncharacterized protein n=1 Tax=Rubrivivax gelatinosus (strain NBRC 100245 / IL144) TaxID=983917 RepID=I0HKY1_RUBGI|nr:hypothetical protein RGE_03230 [Rubrivivax gelatinosus IL144]